MFDQFSTGIAPSILYWAPVIPRTANDSHLSYGKPILDLRNDIDQNESYKQDDLVKCYVVNTKYELALFELDMSLSLLVLSYELEIIQAILT
jgi:hypothetical protein